MKKHGWRTAHAALPSPAADLSGAPKALGIILLFLIAAAALFTGCGAAATITYINTMTFDAAYFASPHEVTAMSDSNYYTISDSSDFEIDGDGKTLVLDDNLSSSADNVGWFGYLKIPAGRTLTIKNLNITTSGSGITHGNNYVGLIAGYLCGGGTLKLENVNVNNAAITASGSSVGGLVGYVTSSVNAKDCKVLHSTISASGSYVGGLVGYVTSSVNAKDCKVLHSTISASGRVGGQVGYVYDASLKYDACSVENCTLSANAEVGGLISCANYMSGSGSLDIDACNVANCVIASTGTNGCRVSGLVSFVYHNSHTIDGCSVANCVIASTSTPTKGEVGGLVGLADGTTITFGVTTGNNVSGCAIYGSSYVGGILGERYGTCTLTYDSKNTISDTIVYGSSNCNLVEGNSSGEGSSVPKTNTHIEEITFYKDPTTGSSSEITSGLYNQVYHAKSKNSTNHDIVVGFYGTKSGYGAISKYTVSFDIGTGATGTVPVMLAVTMGGSVTLASDSGFAKTGYSFGGWSDGINTYAAGASYTPTEDTIVTAVWNPVTVITLNENGGTAGTTSVTATYDSSVLSPSTITNPTKTGYTFGGWNLTNAPSATLINTAGLLCSDVAGYTTGTVWKNTTASMTVYAAWTANTTTITLNANGGTAGTTSVTATYDSGVLSDSITAPTRAGYSFGGWKLTADPSSATLIDTAGALCSDVSGYTDASCNWKKDAAAVTVYAAWTPDTTAITLDANGGAAGTTLVNATYDSSALSPSAIINPTKAGYTFAGWKLTADSSSATLIDSAGHLAGGVSGYTDASGCWKNTAAAVTVYAAWTEAPVPPTPTPTPIPPTPTPTYSPSSGGSEDTGSGHYTEYTRQLSGVTSVSFGSSPVATAVGFSAPVKGEITVSYATDNISDKVRAVVAADGTGKTGGIKNAPYLVTAQNDDYEYEFYEVFRIEGSANTDLSKVCEISFRIPLNALSRQGFTENDVILYHGNTEGTEWAPLNTYLVSTDKVYAYYRAETNGASPFAVVFMEDMAITPEDVTPQESVPVAEQTAVQTAGPAPVQTAEPQPTEASKSPVPAAGILAGFAAAGLLAGFRPGRR